MLNLVLGGLLGILLGGAACAKYLRQEIAAGVSPKLRRLELQLETIESQLNLVIMTQHAELSAHLPVAVPRQQPDRNDHQAPALATSNTP
jgi:hypothetical protein